MSKTILVVEPNDAMRALLVLQLKCADRMDILEVRDGKDAHARLRRANRSVDTIIIARERLGMPVEEVVKTVKNLYPAIRVVVTTTSPYKDETISAMMGAGADVVLWKPWGMKELREALRV